MLKRHLQAVAGDPRTHLAFGVLLAACVLLSCWLAFTPRPLAAAGGVDKLHHVTAFAALALCAAGRRGFAARWAAIDIGLLLVFGVLIEAVQTQLPGRHGELHDIAANALGITIGAALAAGLRRAVID